VKTTRLVVIGLVAALAATVSAPASSTARPAGTTIRLYEKPLSEHFTDLGAKGIGAGDVDVVSYLLYRSPKSTKPVGHSEAVCTLIGPRAASCTSTIYLPNGKIVGGGAFHFQRNGGSEHLAVLGGTGAYAGARGEVTILVRKQDVDVIRLLP
jgi:hypothetical protein